MKLAKQMDTVVPPIEEERKSDEKEQGLEKQPMVITLELIPMVLNDGCILFIGVDKHVYTYTQRQVSSETKNDLTKKKVYMYLNE